ncbi:hypothetical protein GA0074696_4773 [Micromonospora purpureochromogenes]|uniref:Uncharacterized protein n=1 Tax=Micromonospora purpureochromogenes TaxID=47872 RepID=A0A1C4ZRQ8_9ACTN|nr:hypothetical protein [Micromonospora purpureochromogenes]SCF35484.1 hypothetical protein GA0074696_4773 [Micromonospora purpureochromogenes]
MKDILDAPVERDLPPDKAARMRADLMTSIHRPRPRTARRLGIAATVAAAAVVAGVAVAPNGDGVQYLAMGPDELSPTLRQAMEQCLSWNAQHERFPVSMDQLAVAAEQDHHAVALFMTETGYFTCDVSMSPGEEVTGGTSGERDWPQRDWLPGPVQPLLLTSTEINGGDVAVTGRVSARVHRLVLDHGDGHTTAARLTGGVFGLLTEGANVNKDAELVSYDASGTEIGRRLLFRPSDEFDNCYADSSGTLVYGKTGTDCRPAERWNR